MLGLVHHLCCRNGEWARVAWCGICAGRRETGRRETAYFRRAAFCDICAVAMGYGP